MTGAPEDAAKAERLKEVNLAITAVVSRLNVVSGNWEARFGRKEAAAMRTTVLAHILAHGLAAEALVAVALGLRANGHIAIRKAVDTVSPELVKRAEEAYAMLAGSTLIVKAK